MKTIKELTKEIVNALNESYSFDTGYDSDNENEYDSNDESEEDPDYQDKEGEPDAAKEVKDDSSKNDAIDFKSKIKEMRKTSLNVMAELDPEEDSNKYKIMKTIYEACDKFLISSGTASEMSGKDTNNELNKQHNV